MAEPEFHRTNSLIKRRETQTQIQKKDSRAEARNLWGREIKALVDGTSSTKK